jgi:hypothetical protein
MYESGDTMVVDQVCNVFSGTVTYDSVEYTVGETFTVLTGKLTFTGTGNVYVNSTKVKKLTPSEVESLGSKQYFFLRTWQTKSGYYWNDDATCNVSTNALSKYSFNRVANYLADAALTDFTNEIGKNLPVEITTGNLSSTYCKAKEVEFYNNRIQPLINSGDITDAEIVITGVNFSSLRTLNFILRISVFRLYRRAILVRIIAFSILQGSFQL